MLESCMTIVVCIALNVVLNAVAVKVLCVRSGSDPSADYDTANYHEWCHLTDNQKIKYNWEKKKHYSDG